MTPAEPSRDAIKARRYRRRKGRKQKVYYLTARPPRLVDLLVRRGYLDDHVTHSKGMIEEAVSRWVDDEGN